MFRSFWNSNWLHVRRANLSDVLSTDQVSGVYFPQPMTPKCILDINNWLFTPCEHTLKNNPITQSNVHYTQCVLPLKASSTGRVQTLLTTLLATAMWVITFSSSALLSEAAELRLDPPACRFQEWRPCRAAWSSSRAAKTLCRQGSRRASDRDPSLDIPVISSSTALAEEEICSPQLSSLSLPTRETAGCKGEA